MGRKIMANSVDRESGTMKDFIERERKREMNLIWIHTCIVLEIVQEVVQEQLIVQLIFCWL